MRNSCQWQLVAKPSLVVACRAGAAVADSGAWKLLDRLGEDPRPVASQHAEGLVGNAGAGDKCTSGAAIRNGEADGQLAVGP